MNCSVSIELCKDLKSCSLGSSAFAMFTRLKVCCASYERKQTDKINNFSCRYLDYSSTQNSKEKVSEVSDIQKGLCKHDYEIDVVEEILPLQRVRVLVRCTISRLSPSLCFGWVGLPPTLPIQNTESLSQAIQSKCTGTDIIVTVGSVLCSSCS